MHRPEESVVEFRAARDADRAAVQALVDHDVARTPYADVVRYFVRLAFDGRPEESRAIVAAVHHEVAGVALCGAVAGAVGTGRLHFVAVSASARRRGIGVGLCDAALSDMARKGARLVIAELPDDGVVDAGRVLLTRAGFSEVARVADYYRDRVDLVILGRAIDAGSDDTSAGST